ncbi:MAG: flagellar filament capping protein FliD [Myxococcota bacterium]
MTTAIDGIVSGIDTTGLINAIISAESGQISAMEATQSGLEAKRERTAALSTRLSEVSSAIDEIDEVEDWDLAKITSADADAFVADADDDATQGTYTIQVNALAKAQVQASGGFADRAAAGTIAQGDLVVDVGGVSTTITIDGTNDTLGDLAALLDEVDGITAYTVNDGDASTPWRLVVQADDTGSSGTFTFDTTGLTASAGATIPAMSVVTAAEDAEVEVNGVTISSSSNVINNIVPGIDLTLRTEGGPAEVLTIEQDKEGLIDQLEAIVDAFNAAETYYDESSFFNSESGNRGPLAGDSTTRRAMSQIGSLLTNSYTVSNTDFTSLAELGLSTNRDGTVAFDRDAFETALEDDRDSVITFLTSVDGPLVSLKSNIDDVWVDSEDGALTNRTESLNESIEGYDERIADFQEYLDGYSERLRSQFTSLEVTLSRLQAQQSQLASLFAGNSQS